MFKQKFVDLCIKRNEAPSMVLMKLGLSSAAFSNWTDKTVPRKTTLTKIANYFGITIEELTQEDATAPAEEKSPAELHQELAELWEQLDEAGQEEAMRYLEYLRSRRNNG
jgi:transcriptional regulator with XRE-family HTH domain